MTVRCFRIRVKCHHLSIAIRFFGLANACRDLFAVKFSHTLHARSQTVADILQNTWFLYYHYMFSTRHEDEPSAEDLLRYESIVVHILSAIISARAAARPSTSSSAAGQAEARPSTSSRVRAEARPSTSSRVRARRPVVARAVEPEQEPERAESEREQARAVEQAPVAEQALAVEQAPVAEQALAVEQAPVAEQARAVEQAPVAEQTRAVELERELIPD
jgi:hypothetical protein